MPKLQTFDGPELDGVLARVREEGGGAARIVSATKVRKGGIGGFFSKEAFKVSVELPDDEPVAPEQPKAPAAPRRQLTAEPMPDLQPPPSSLFELVDLIDEAEAVASAAPAPAPTPAPAPVVPEAPAPVVAPALEIEPAVVRAPAPMPSTESSSFQSVLRRISSEAGAPAPMPAPVPAPMPAPMPAPVPVPAPVAAPATVVRAPRMPIMVTGVRELVAPEHLRTLNALGLPEELVPHTITPEAAVLALLHSLQLPVAAPVPAEAGQVTVIIGERGPATRLANELAAEMGLTTRHVVVAEHDPEGKASLLVTPAEARAQRSTWTKKPRLVALSAPPGSEDLDWAWDMLTELQPSAIWGVVGADRKCEDIEAWSSALGGFDALALEDLDLTVSPASMLALGIPVARLDGEQATTQLWASLLAERLAA